VLNEARAPLTTPLPFAEVDCNELEAIIPKYAGDEIDRRDFYSYRFSHNHVGCGGLPHYSVRSLI